MLELKGKYNSCKVFTDNIDSETISQLTNLLNQEFVSDSQVRIMPDTHAGKGCVIGTTMTITDKIVPNLVGVVVGIRNVCSTFLRIGFGDSCEVVNFLEYYHRMGRTLGCIYCKYRNKKSDCLKNCILERK